ncbi:hypothetical protein CDD83_3060 [Cordyceps sp. RAO-2017]|nr:hypothetical protein CDD83_3060 [Cordyceps sp. RAO-2017]
MPGREIRYTTSGGFCGVAGETADAGTIRWLRMAASATTKSVNQGRRWATSRSPQVLPVADAVLVDPTRCRRGQVANGVP